MKNLEKYIVITSAACIIASIGEFVTIFALGAHFPGYSQLGNTMSSLGASDSPVSNLISTWWVIMGFLFIFFGTGFYKAFSDKGGFAKIAALLIILYGFGEGIGSGAFKADYDSNGLTTLALVHDALGGIGVVAILAFPLIMLKVIPKIEMPGFYRMSIIIFVTGIITILLFMFRFSSDDNNFLSTNKGLWQRLFMLNTYIYQVFIAVIMIKRQRQFKQN
jgi:hypothetical protein